MKKIRRGNDFVFAWEIERNGLPEDLSSVLEKHLYLSALGKRVELVEGVDYDITGNVARIEITPTIANILGTYKAEFHYVLPDIGLIDEDRKCAVDVDAFIIVSSTAQADDPSEFTVTSDMAIAFKGDKGDSSYQTWLDAGNTGTEADYLAWIRQPATDIEQVVSSNETVRISSEETRQLNETARVEAEALRGSAETQRISDENTRKSNETGRVNAEALRAEAETARNTAEGERQTNTATAILQTNAARDLANEKAGLAATATTEANTARDEANLAATAANTKAGEANTAAMAANTAAGLADTARTELTTAVNTKLGEADGKIEEMNTTLSTYDGRVTQVEADIDQLAGEVSLLDAVHSDKIKDIENVLSSANLGQSAQLSVSGVSPLSLPKNAANGGMQVKLEGLTQDVGGVITHFYPTGRIRSVGRNLYNKDKMYLPINGTSGGYVAGTVSDNLTGSDFIPIKEGTAYKILGATNSTSSTIGLAFYDKDKVFIGGSTYGVVHTYIESYVPSSATLITKPSPVGARFLRFTVRIISNPLLSRHTAILTEVGNSNSYESYRSTSLYLTAPELRSNGTVKDEIRKGANGYELVKRISEVDGTVLATPVISPVSYGGILNSAERGTVYHEPIIADAGVYGTNLPILNTDYPIASIEEIIKHEGGVDTYLNASTAVIAPDGLSFTHPDLASGDLVLFTYAFDKESTNGNITATFYDSNVVKIDTVTGKAYKITDVVTNGVLTRTLTEV